MPALTKEQIDAWNKRNQGAFEGLLNVNQFMPVTGDIQSGVMAGQDISQGNYGSAALNAVGLLPFVPALGGMTSSVRSVLPGLLKNAYSGEKAVDSAQKFKRTFKLKDGARISGTNTPDNSVLYGYDKNGELFTVRPEYLTPDQFTNINEYKALFGE